MITDQVQGTYDIAALDETASDIWKRLTIIKTEAWFSTVSAIANEHQLTAKLESRYRKSAIICDVDGCRIGRIWHLDENMPIFWDRRQWISRYESANTISEAVDQIVKNGD